MNTVKIIRAADGRVLSLEGYNTDVDGFKESVADMTSRLSDGQGALVLGTGGASKAVAEALRQLGIGSLRYRATKSVSASYATATSQPTHCMRIRS